MRIGIIGGTGPAGQAVGLRLAANGGTILLGSRSPDRAEEIAATLRESWPARDLAISGASNEDAAASEIVILATPWDAVPSTVTGLRSALAGQVVVSMVNALTRVGREFQAIIPARGSVAAMVQALLPKSEIAAAFQHLPAGPLASLDDPIEADVLVCADTARAFEATKALIELVPGLRGIAAGSLASANAVEALTAVLLNANRSEKAHLAVRLVRVDGARTVTMRLYDTARTTIVPFTPGPVVTMYTCGITPYDSAHIGHAATYLTYDVLQRRLRDLGHETRCVRNVTDVDDDILRKARSLGVHYLDLAAEEIARFDEAMDALGLLKAFAEPRATSAIPDILGFIGMVLDSGHAYQAGGAVYFDVSSFPGFGELSHLDRATMLELAAERGGNVDDPYKEDPLDFVLWQRSLPDEPSWESLWGPGRPGWHIECSALALRELGLTIDLHGGGSDLIFPHHECELAQSTSATGEPFVRHWMHVGMVCLGGEKMSKSLGNLVFVGELVKKHDPAVVRLAILSHHYRGEWEWQDELLDVATDRLARWRATGDGAGALDDVRSHLDDDLDTPGALVAIDDAASRGEGVSQAAALLGIV